MARFLTIVLLLHVSLIVVALVDCLSARERGIRVLPRAAWIFLILLASPVGAFAWLLLGKPLPAGPREAQPSQTQPSQTQPSQTQPSQIQPRRVERRRPMRPFGPEDDPAFIASLAASMRGNDGD
jgi:hypothetical protein